MEEAKPYQNRPYLRILYECCGVYQRIYRHPSGHYYQGNCPKCLRPVVFKVGSEGTSSRSFAVR